MHQLPETRLLQRLQERLAWIIFRCDFDILEALLGITTMLWGAWLLSPFWDTFPVSRSYAAMSALGPEWAWGLVVMAVGLFQQAASALERRKWRAWAAVLAVVLWTFISASLIRSNPYATAIIAYPTLFVVPEILIYWRLMGRRS